MNETFVTMSGNVVNDPVARFTRAGASFTTFRLASTARRYDASVGGYVDAGTNFVDVACFRALGENVAACVRKGQPVVVTGRLRVNEWHKDEKRGVDVCVDATAVGHDLARGTASFQRVRPGLVEAGTNPLRAPGGGVRTPEPWESPEPVVEAPSWAGAQPEWGATVGSPYVDETAGGEGDYPAYDELEGEPDELVYPQAVGA